MTKSFDPVSAAGNFELEDHGGECCGIMHLYGFDDELLLDDHPTGKVTIANRVATIQAGVQRCLRSRASYDHDKQMLVEVVLSEYQWRDWDTAVKRAGFKKVTEFRNSNSGRVCRVYHHKTNQ